MQVLVGRQNWNHSSFNLTCSIVVGAGAGLVGGRPVLLRIFIVVQHMAWMCISICMKLIIYLNAEHHLLFNQFWKDTKACRNLEDSLDGEDYLQLIHSASRVVVP